MKKIIGPLISVAFLIGLFFFVRDQIQHVLIALKNADPMLLGAGVTLFLLSMIILAWRLRLIFKAENINVSIRETTRLTFVGYFFNNFLPTSVGGDIVKTMCAAKITGENVRSVTTVMMDRIFGLFTFILIPSASLFFLRDQMNPKVPIIIYTFLAFSIFCFVLLFNRSVARRFHFIELIMNRFGLGSKLRQVYDGLHEFRNRKAVVMEAMILSLIGQGTSIFSLFLSAMALGAPPSIALKFFLLVPVVHLISMFPSINGLGIREFGYAYFLKACMDIHLATAVGLIYLGYLILASIIGGVVYLFSPDFHLNFKNNTSGSVA